MTLERPELCEDVVIFLVARMTNFKMVICSQTVKETDGSGVILCILFVGND